MFFLLLVALVKGSQRVCVAGGLSGATYLNSVECWDPVGRVWAADPSLVLPIALAYMAPFNSSTGSACVAGGMSGSSTYVANAYCLNTTGTPRWSPIANVPTPLSGRANMAVMYPSGVAHLVAGQVGASYAADTISISGSTWLSQATISGSRAGAIGAPTGGQWCIWGGKTTAPADGYCWNGAGWDATVYYMATIIQDASAFQINGLWCVGGGYSGTTVQCLTSSHTWTNEPSYALPSATINGNANSFTLDGYPCLGSTTNVYCYTGSTWQSYPGFQTPRSYVAAFTYDAPAPPTAAPTTPKPTTFAPTTFSPTPAPTTLQPITTAPTTSAPTTMSPTTSAPTTMSPTTSAPTTIAPTTIMPTKAPTTLAPTTLAPTTAAPTTLTPTTLAPTTLAPTTLTPTTAAPTTLAPTLSPTTIAPTTVAPTAPTTIAPTPLIPTTVRPTTFAPTTFSPTTGTPTTSPTSAPTTYTPTTFSPTTKTPTIAPTTAPTTLAPTTFSPTTNAPTTFAPTTNTPTTFLPTTYAPTTFAPTTSAPTTSAPTAGPTSAPTPLTNAPTPLTNAPTPLTNAPTPLTNAPTPLTSSPTPGPTLSPTTAPSVLSTESPTTSTLAPTSALWELDYPSRFLSMNWVTFALSVPNGVQPAVPLSQAHWQFFRANGTDLNITQSSGNGLLGASLTIPPWSFTAGENYLVEVVLAGAGQRYPFSLDLAPLEIVVQGGNKDVAAHSSITLDGSSSRDPDLPTLGGLTFTWFASCQHAMIIGSTNSPTVRLQTGGDEVCDVRLIVTSPSFSKTSTLSVTLSVISSVFCNITITRPESASSYIASSDTLRLLASLSISPTLITTFTWSVRPAQICVLPTPSSSTSRALSLAPGCLQAGTTYNFTFTVADAQGKESSAMYPVSVVGPPSGGICTLSPVTGFALSTPFDVQCSGWTQQGPIQISPSYSVGTIAATGSSTLTPSQSQGNFTLVFPQSASTQLVVYIYGYRGTVTSFLLPAIKVLPNPSSSGCSLSGFTSSSSASTSSSLQNITAAYQQMLVNGEGSCSASTINITWNLLWSTLQHTIQAQIPAAITLPTLDTLVWSFEVAIRTAPLLNSNTTTSILREGIVDILQFFDEAVAALPITVALPCVQKIIALDSLLFTPFIADKDCVGWDQAAEAVTKLVRTATAGSLPSDPTLTLGGPDQTSTSSSDLTVQSAFFFGDQPGLSLSSASGAALDAPTALLQQAGEVGSITVTQFGSNLQGMSSICRQAGELTIASPGTVDITLSDHSGQPLTVMNVRGGFSFDLLVAAAQSDSCGAVKCAWWDPAHSEWNSTGCSSPMSIPGSNPPSFKCSCTHLTEFTLLLRTSTCQTLRGGYLVMVALYAIALLLTLVKIGHRAYANRLIPANKPIVPQLAGIATIVWQHVLLAALCAVRLAASLTLSSPSTSNAWSLPFRAIILVLPYALMFWIYTLMVFQWASVFHFGMKFKGQAFGKVKMIFLGCNIMVCGVMIALLTTLSTASSESSKNEIAVIATAVLATITFITAGSFLVYSGLIYHSMHSPQGASRTTSSLPRTSTNSVLKSPSNLSLSSSSSRSMLGGCCDLNLRTKILLGGIIVSSLLCIEAIMHVVSLVAIRALGPISNNGASADITELVVLAADWLGILVLLAMYHKAMNGDASKPTNGDKKSSIQQGGIGEKSLTLAATKREPSKRVPNGTKHVQLQDLNTNTGTGTGDTRQSSHNVRQSSNDATVDATDAKAVDLEIPVGPSDT